MMTTDHSFTSLRNVMAETNSVLDENEYQIHNDGADFEEQMEVATGSSTPHSVLNWR